jgi:hypothetical protein
LQPEGLHYIKEEKGKGGGKKEERKEGKREEEGSEFHQFFSSVSLSPGTGSNPSSLLNKNAPA